MTPWERLQARLASFPCVRAAGCWIGKSGDWISLDPGWSAGGSGWLKHLRDTVQVARLHRLPMARLQWEFEKGTLLAACGEDWLRAVLASDLSQTNLEALWAILEGND